MKEVLAELKNIYFLYFPLWSEWTSQRSCGLNTEEIYMINALAMNNFKGEIEDSVMFYYKVSVVNRLIKTLKSNYSAFKTWVIEKLVGALIWRGLKYEDCMFFKRSIFALSISDELKIALLKFNRVTLIELLCLTRKRNFKSKQTFAMVLHCTQILLYEEKFYRKEVSAI